MRREWSFSMPYAPSPLTADFSPKVRIYNRVQTSQLSSSLLSAAGIARSAPGHGTNNQPRCLFGLRLTLPVVWGRRSSNSKNFKTLMLAHGFTRELIATLVLAGS
jgi:hypothetical protein